MNVNTNTSDSQQSVHSSNCMNTCDDMECNNIEFVEDQEAFESHAQIQGLPYESLLQQEDMADIHTDGVYSLAPAEGQKPIAILNDQHFEEMCNPTKYPYGINGLVTERLTRLTVRKYFNQRILNADGRFAKDIEIF